MATETLQQDAQTQTRDADEFASLLNRALSREPSARHGTSEFRQSSGRAGARGYQPHQIRRARHDRGDDCAAGQETFAQMNEIMHAPEFQQLEGAWRGMKYLVFQSETDAMLKIRVDECLEGRALPAPAALSERRLGPEPLFKKVYEEEFGQLGGQPMAADRRLQLQSSAERRPIAARPQQDRRRRARAVLRRCGLDLDGMDSWNELMNPRDLSKLFDTPEYAAWRSCAIPTTRVMSPLYAARARPVAIRRQDRAC